MANSLVARGVDFFGDYRSLMKSVPGIGGYAARAIMCFGLGEAVGIVDANVARIFRRVFCVRSYDSRAVIYQHLADAVARVAADPRSANFGLLDLGALVCIRRPKCVVCPFARFCPRFGVD